MTGIKHDANKPKLSMLPWPALVEVCKVVEYGAQKYAHKNYLGLDPQRLLDAALRHLSAHCSGEEIDPESNLPHIHHAATSLLLFIETVKHQNHGIERENP